MAKSITKACSRRTQPPQLEAVDEAYLPITAEDLKIDLDHGRDEIVKLLRLHPEDVTTQSVP